LVVGSLVQRAVGVGESGPVASEIVGHHVDGVQQLAQLRHVVALVETEFGQRHGHSDFPVLALSVKGAAQLLHEVEELVLVGELATAVGSTRVLPVQIETVKAILFHEL